MSAIRHFQFGWAGAAIAAAVALAFASGQASLFARGWLFAFVLVSMVPIGSLALLLVHGITGGRWGEDLAPALVPAARAIPLLLLAVLPILILRSLIYDWPAHGVPADVARYYLNPPFFAARTIFALVIWSIFAWRGIWKSQLGAGLGLAAHAVILTFIPADWVLTIRPGSTNAGFGLGFGIEQLFAALAFAALLAPQGKDARANRDLAGMMVTALLGTVYFFYMQYIVTWYGNIPEKVDWYAARAGGAWPSVAFAGFVLGAAIPFLAVLHPAVRRGTGKLRLLGISVLSGITLHVAWLTIPVFGPAVLAPALLSVVTMVLLVIATVRSSPLFVRGHGNAG
jgi:hypothetical protein